jgi:hypothetical protein
MFQVIGDPGLNPARMGRSTGKLDTVIKPRTSAHDARVKGRRDDAPSKKRKA